MGKLINGIIKAVLDSKTKKVSASGTKVKSFADAVEDIEKGMKKLNDLIENDPEIEKELDRLGL